MRRRLLRLLYRLLPEETRSLYGAEMEATFLTEQRHARSRTSVVHLWLATIADVFRTAPAEHLDIFRRDTRYALRSAGKHALHAAAAVITLALAIAANVTLFAVVDAVLLEPLPYGDPRALVQVKETDADRDASNLGYATFVDVRQRAHGFEHLVAVAASTATLTDGGLEAERVKAMRVSSDYFDMLGVQPRHGRVFSEEEDRPGDRRRVVILSHSLFERRFGADPDVVDSTILISGLPYRVVGVMPQNFHDLIAERIYLQAELWYPLGYDPTASYACRSCRHLSVFGRLAPGSDAAAAQSELTSLLQGLESEHPSEYHQAGASVTPLREVFLGAVRPVLLVLWVGVFALLLVACANVANFLLLRASERGAEVRIRAALGVTPARLTRQLMTEALLLSTLAGALSLIPAWAAIRFLAAAGPGELPRLSAATLDLRAFGVSLGLVFASALLFGLAPLRHLARRSETTTSSLSLAHSRSRSTGSAATWRLRSALLAFSVALAVVLLVGSGLLVRTLDGLLAVEPGFSPDNTLTLQLWATGQRFRAENRTEQIGAAVSFYEEVLANIEALPGARSAAGVSTLPLGGGVDGYSIHVVGRETDNPEAAPSADRFVVTPGFFETLQIGLDRGRHLGNSDQQNAELVALINRTAAKELFPSGDVLGQHIRLGPQDAAERKIVGVVPDVTHHGLDQTVGYQVYVPQAQWAWAETFLTLVVRAEAGHDVASLAHPVRDAIRRVDSAQPVTDVRSYDEILASATATRRFAAQLLTSFAIGALLLSVIGLYTAVGVLVGQRRREIGLRIALGARAPAIRLMMLLRGLRPVAVGLAVGLTVAMLSTSALRSLVYGIDPLDPLVFTTSVAILALTAAGACLVPAWRAAAIDPTANLRAE